MEIANIANTCYLGNCKRCTYYANPKGKQGWCTYWAQKTEQNESCIIYKKRHTKSKNTKCHDCIRYKAINGSIGRCSIYGAQTRKDSTCRRYIKKSKN